MNCDNILSEGLAMTRRLALVACVLAGALLAACSGGADDELLVFAATSLTDAMAEAAAEFEATHGTKVEVSYGPSRALAQQIARGANPDVYVAAGQPPMDFLQEGGHIADGGAVRLLSNKIVLITGRDAPSIGGISELADADLNRVAMPDPEIAPAGNYARTALQNLGLWEQMLPRIVFANDVRATLSYVQTGNADAGFLYQTDAANAEDITVLDIVPTDSYPDVVYPAAVVRSTDNVQGAEALLEFLQSDAGREIFRRHGFTPLE
jgi:molybdate transport system substrate-binding protein